MNLRSRLRSALGAALTGGSAGSELTQRIRGLEEALERHPDGSSERAPILNDLGNRFRDRYLVTGSVDDLEASIGHYQDALSLVAEPALAVLVRGNLSVALLDRYAATRAIADLDAAIQTGREAVVAAEPGTADPSRHLGNLSNALHERYYRTRDRADLDAATDAAQQAMEQAVPGSREYASGATNLAVALLDRGGRDAMVNVNRAIELLETAAASLSDGSPEHTRVLTTLNVARLYRVRQYGQREDPVDTARALDELKRAAARSPAGSLPHHSALHSIGKEVWRQYQGDRQPSRLEEAIAAFEGAVASAGENVGELPLYLNDLGIALSERSFISDSAQGLAQALAAWVRALNVLDRNFAIVPVTYKLGQQSVSVELGIAERVVFAYLTLADRAVSGRDRLLQNAMWSAETTKSRILTQLVGRDGEPPAPGGVSPEQVARERMLVEELRGLDTAELMARGEGTAPADGNGEGRLAQREAMHGELEALWAAMEAAGPAARDYVASRRGTPPTWQTLAGLAASLGPTTALVSMFSTNSRTLMFVLRAGKDAPEVAEIDIDQAGWYDVLGRFDEEVRWEVRSSAETWDGRMRSLAEAAAPYLEGAERVILAPYGWGLQIPWSIVALRAGWRAPDGGALPIVTLEALGLLPGLLGRPRHGRGPAIVVGNPTGDLPQAESEAATVAELLGVAPLIGAAATRDAVLRGMRTASVAHLAAHAGFESGSPLDSGVKLADGVLTAREILAESIDLDLLVLSACETAVAESLGGHEFAGLSQAFLQAGVRCLVASLWKVDDLATAKLMTSFYRNWHDGADLARALSDAATAGRGDSGLGRANPWNAFIVSGDWSARWPSSVV